MNTQPDHEAIKALAHQLWAQRGKPIGSSEQDWFEAERQLQGKASASTSKGVDESVKQSFPASDPPASRLPDEPPVNAEAKWAAAGVDRDELCRTADSPTLGKAKERASRTDSHR